VDDGYFPRERSILHRVHRERAVGLLYGQRALCLGALKPLNYVGTSEHTHNKRTPFRRLAHTAAMFETVLLGTRAEADRVLGAVKRMHERVTGVLPQDAGAHYPAGTPYSAFDPELMLWTVAVTADSAQWLYDQLVRRLTATEREALWQDYIRFGELFGMPRETAPPTYPEFRAWYEEQLAGADLHLTEEARYMGHAAAFEIPMPRSSQPAKRVHDLIMLGSLPPRVRRLYGLSYTPLQAAAHAAALAATERRRIARGLPTPQLQG
jgi:uncharacterized protein (DUF2236 family)